MVEECTDDRFPQEQAAEILDSVIRLRKSHDQFEKPNYVNALVRLFPCVQLSEGYILDYEQVKEREVVTGIRPFTRKKDEEEGETQLLDFLQPDMEGLTDQYVETFYQFLIYKKTPRGLFVCLLRSGAVVDARQLARGRMAGFDPDLYATAF